MKIANIYSLLHDRWFINEEYGHSLLPLAFNLIAGNQAAMVSGITETVEEFISIQSSERSTHQRAASAFNQNDNDKGYVLIVDLKNPIYKYNQECGPRGTKHKMGLMAQYENDPNLKGVVLDIDSGGGQVSGTPEFYDFIKNYSKPVVTYTDGYMCSAAYYIGSAASHIVANKRADKIGSIGTMVHFIDVTGIYEKKGAKVITEYATKSTEKNKDFEELIKGNPEGYIKNELDPITDNFHEDMKAARPALSEKCLSGGTWNATTSKKLGLIDEIGTMQTAIDKVFELASASENKSNINNKTMNTENLSQLNAALDVENLASTDEGVFLNEDQLNTLNQRLADDAAAITTAQNALQTESDNLTAAIADSTAIAGAVTDALADAEVENRENLTTLQGVEALSALVAEYGNEDGDDATNVPAGTNQESTNPNIVGGIDISDGMNN